MVPSTPRVAEEAVSIMTTSNASPRNDTGIAILLIALNCSLSPQNQKAVKRKRRGVFMDTEPIQFVDFVAEKRHDWF